MDLNFIKDKLSNLKGQKKQSPKFWKPADGEQKVRIVPYKYNKENPFIELKFYYYRQPNGTTKTFLSPSINGNPDPVLEHCAQLRSTGTKENWIRSKQYEPKLRTYVPVIVRGEEDKGVRFWGFGKQVYEAILEEMSDPDIGDITDLQEGNDLTVTFTKNPPSGKKFPETKIKARVKKTPVFDQEKLNLLPKLDDQVDIMTLFTEPSYDELLQEFEAQLNPENDVPPVEVQDAESDTDDTVAPLETAVPVEENPTVETPTESTPSVQEVVSPTAQMASVNMTPEERKAIFKKMFADASKTSVK